MINNLSESLRARLLNISKNTKQDFQTILMRFKLERLLYRIGQSKYNKQFLLKGAMLFALWYDMPYRPTMDMDLLSFGDSDLLLMKKIFQEITSLQFEDGVVFDSTHIKVERILEETSYVGVKITISAELAKAKSILQIDIGFGDAVTPEPAHSIYPTLIKDLPSPQLRTYPVYTVVAEKLHAIADHAMRNSRLKDYLDLLVILEKENLDTNILAKAIAATFARRGSEITKKPLAGLSDEFANDSAKQLMWISFLKRNHLSDKPLYDVINTLRNQLQPILNQIAG